MIIMEAKKNNIYKLGNGSEFFEKYTAKNLYRL